MTQAEPELPRARERPRSAAMSGRNADGVWLSTVTRFVEQQLVELVRRAADRVGHHHQPSTVEQGPPDLPDREVEGERVEQRPDVVPVELEPWLGGAEQPDDVVVGDQHALGYPRGAGGVDDVGQVVRRRQSGKVGVALPARVGVGIQAQHAGGGVWQRRQEVLAGSARTGARSRES